MVYLRKFDAKEWIRLVRDEGVTTATVVPTMLDRIVSVLETEAVGKLIRETLELAQR